MKLKATIYFKSGNKLNLKVTKCELDRIDGKRQLDIEVREKIAYAFVVDEIECIITRKSWF